MKPTDSINNTDRLNYLNIGLMVFSCVLAFIMPFELFLFAYAVLGPAHYFTEISWLHERKYFTKGKYDFVLLGGLAFVLFLLIYGVSQKFAAKHEEVLDNLKPLAIFIAFAGALVMVLAKNTFQRLLGLIGIIILATFSNDATVLLTVFLPTLVHVYIFTGFFILFGALKGRSRSGYISFAVFLLCPLLFFFIYPDHFLLTDYAMKTYPRFEALNRYSLDIFADMKVMRNSFASQQEYTDYLAYVRDAVYHSKPGVILMRFIAFAYTYHYLNWFSKTSVIKWHQVPKRRLVVIGVLWAASVGLYLYDYKVGFDWLFCISFMHVFLEFPLNHTTIMGTFRELRAIATGKPVAASAPQKKGKKK